jgi:hypothetical protein
MWIIPTRKPEERMANVTIHYLNGRNCSQITVMTAAARATALSILSVYIIRKKMTEKN